MDPHLSELSTDRKPACTGGNYDETYAARAFTTGPCCQEDIVGYRTVGNEGLGPVNNEGISLPSSRGPDGAYVRTRGWFGNSKASKEFPFDGGNKVLLFQFLASLFVNGGGAHLALHENGNGSTNIIGPGKLLAEDQGVPEITTAPTVLLVIPSAEDAHFTQLLEDLPRDLPHLLPMLAVRFDFSLNKVLHRLSEHFVFTCKWIHIAHLAYSLILKTYSSSLKNRMALSLSTFFLASGLRPSSSTSPTHRLKGRRG